MNGLIKPYSLGQILAGISKYSAILIYMSAVMLDIEAVFTTPTHIIQVVKVVAEVVVLWMAILYLALSITEEEKKTSPTDAQTEG